MRALGSKGGRGRRGLGKLPATERQSLRDYLREQVDPAEVWQALKAALESGSQTAVVSAARLIVTELYEEREEADYRAKVGAEMKAKSAEAGEKILKIIISRGNRSSSLS
jgi:hypothetical protein